jgi:hypothetical protein
MAQMILVRPSPSIRIDPDRLMAMLLWGLVCGAALGVLWDVFRLTRVMLGVTYPLKHVPVPDKERNLPLLGRPLPSRTGKDPVWKRWMRPIVIFCEDVLFGVTCGTVMSLLIYVTNDGIFRVMAPVGMLVGFLVYYVTVGRLVLSLSQWIVYIIRVLLCYATALLLLPPRVALWIWKRTVGAWLKSAAERIRMRRALQYHEKTLRELTVLAESGWMNECDRMLRKGGWSYAIKQKTRQKNDDRITQYADLSGADRDLCHHLFCDQADGEQQAQAGAGCVAGADRRGKAKGVRSAVRHRRTRG